MCDVDSHKQRKVWRGNRIRRKKVQEGERVEGFPLSCVSISGEEDSDERFSITRENQSGTHTDSKRGP